MRRPLSGSAPILFLMTFSFLFFPFLSLPYPPGYSGPSDQAAHTARAAADIPETPAPSPTGVLRILDIGERTYNNGPAVAVVVSDPLDPAVRHDDSLRISTPEERLRSAWVLSSDGRTLWFPHVTPETTYTVTVLPELTAQNGWSAGKRITREVKIRPITPAVGFAGEGFILPARKTRGLPVITVNVEEVSLEFFRLTEEGLLQYINWRKPVTERETYSLERLSGFGELVFEGRFTLDAPPNRRVTRHIPVTDIQALEEPGIYLAVLHRPGQYDYAYQTACYLVSDIGLHARSYADRSVIFARSLATGAPLSGVTLQVLKQGKNRLMTQAVTNAEGRADLEMPLPGGARLMLAHMEVPGTDGGAARTHYGILPLHGPALDMSGFDLGDRLSTPLSLYLYSPRDLYRPGETAVFSLILRDQDALPADTVPLVTRLLRPDGKEVRTFTWHPDETGKLDQVDYYQHAVSIPEDATTGLWRLQVFIDPEDKTPDAEYAFHVEDFLPERMKLDLAVSPENPKPDADLTVSARGMYLYGAPAAGNDIAARVRVRALRELPDAHEQFEFGRVDDAAFSDAWDLPDDALSDEGKAEIQVDSQWSEIKSPLTVSISVDLFESGGRPVTRRVSANILPAPRIIGIRPMFERHVADEGLVRFEVIQTDVSGNLYENERLEVEFIREDRDYYWEYTDGGGWRHRYTEKIYSWEKTSMSLPEGKPGTLETPLTRGGYVLAITDPASGQMTSVRFRVGDWWWSADDRAARPDKIAMTLDKPAYQAGDTAVLTLVPPHAGKALVMVEADRLLWERSMVVTTGENTLKIPILGSWNRHDLYISAVVFRPADADETAVPNRAVGLLHLRLDRENRRLPLSIAAPSRAQPEKQMRVRLALAPPAPEGSEAADQNTSPLAVSDENPVFVTVAAVDEGILRITDFVSPDPFSWFFERRRFNVSARDMYDRVIEQKDAARAVLRFGGDADLKAGERPENEVKLVSLFSGPVPFAADGTAEVSFHLPDFNGELRLMAVAFSGKRFGAAQTAVTVAAPVVTQMAMPRFLAPGDRSEATLDLHNLSGADRDFSVSVISEGAVELFEGDRKIRLKDKEKISLRFPLLGRDAAGKADLSLSLNEIPAPVPGSAAKSAADSAGSPPGESGDGAINLSRSWVLGVRPGYPAIARKRLYTVAPRQEVTVDTALAADMIPENLNANLKISPRFPIDIGDAVRGLIDYPYGCLEQTTSRAWPLLYATPARAARYDLPRLAPEERMKRLRDAVDRLGKMQRGSGGFGLWHNASPEDGWLTAFVTDFLLTASDHGVPLPDNMLEKALERLESYVKKSPPLPAYMDNRHRSSLEFAIAAYAACALNRANRLPLGAARIVFDDKSGNADSCLPLIHMGLALAGAGDHPRSDKAFALARKRLPEEIRYWGHYGSPVRDTALSLALLMEENLIAGTDLNAYMTHLETAVRTRRWFSTQEKFALFRAGIAMDARPDEPWKGRLSIGAGDARILKTGGVYIAPLSAAGITSGVRFVNDGSLESGRPLFVSALVSGYTRNAPPEENAGIAIRRDLFTTDGAPADAGPYHVGDLLVARLTIRSEKDIPDALVADLLPAGFEVENQHLEHTEKQAGILMDGRTVDDWMADETIHAQEYRDDRYMAALDLDSHRETRLFYLIRVVSPGEFSVPPPFAESMYQPEIRGIGPRSSRITVVNRSRKSGSGD